ncbi:ADP-ribose pyrophosphatase [Planctomycetes bacterium CA13]|uniref:ADP-ribose pyrophosphatase n=1 Tax=Novipirellula herctigrandis TaxID=2527986 RepID=A0A5C5Z7B1_9BACT|nr:ADP-ribose pyrophosphatase [Planctomycetes bacterium CA13]
MKEIETVASKIVYQNRWMTVREDAIRRSDGDEGIYGIVEKPDFAVIAAVESGSVFLVEQYRYPLQKRVWELPQGSWESNEVAPIDLAKAELQEEVGIVAGNMTPVGHLFLACGYSRQGYNVFLATDLQRTQTCLDPEERGLISQPFKIAEVEAMICEGIIEDATTVAVMGLLRLKQLL